MEYQYPFSMDWSTQEVIDVVHFFEAIEKAYEKGIKRDELLSRYRRFKEIVPGKADEKKFCNEFEEVSGYSPYRAVKKMKESESGLIKM
ncbi:UPF0223 family protein [Heyndrickxia ginsengihumi]|uniref:UPF0223 protein G4D61_01760 n=1 Tax=Heyndrickxia ginsengihumi TaxID=363870 RepID=A0A0A6V9Q6_9BACI|nr:UPF0223 family protein [Heyndrickxia ginsengihumi]KHD84296.1 hypothetical protein NG54_16435 [Heyndrickxia ginsengihumi]MBE6183655.1 UPF0223 family protein [Bacillus sp. (in: firmicutes)]MCM3022365.1 UPF0223 family protein [Heyndrickxia ginsengihumi]NEY18693.1 UPF0223 family protein [Heyndrickxia ginsengihumi]